MIAHSGRGRQREQADAHLLNDIRRIYADNDRKYGSPRVYRELRQTVSCGKESIERLMRENGLKAKQAKKLKVTTDSNHSLPVAPNVLASRFEWERPNQAWVGDITYIATDEGWLYLAVLIDLFSRRIVGWAMDKRITRHMPPRALHMAAQRRGPPKGLIHHADQGSQCASGDYRKALASYGMICSMSARGRCYDNAVAESFFHTLKVELVHDRRFAPRDQAMSAISKLIEVDYNTRQMHLVLGYVSTAELARVALRRAARPCVDDSGGRSALRGIVMKQLGPLGCRWPGDSGSPEVVASQDHGGRGRYNLQGARARTDSLEGARDTQIRLGESAGGRPEVRISN